MIVTVKRVQEDYTACNFCREAVHVDNNLVYPYQKVIEFKGNHNGGITVAICRKCLAELIDKAEGLL